MKPHEAWLIKAGHDLGSARKLMEGADQYPDTSAYHAQQCAEKAFKAFLAFCEQPIHKTHDVGLLVELCAALDMRCSELLQDASAFRYPDVVMSPDVADVEDAIVRAERIYSFITKLIAGERLP
ncbi:MAG TPA: HEPN domain-containing protein [Dissulfurispiraceae bacterium]|nr:HEPN domain-containing protein [Dissulfurispiraceae bacterium]